MRDEGEMSALIDQIVRQLDTIISDTSVPKNVRGAVVEAKQKLNEKGDYVVRVSSAIYHLDSISNDVNLPQHARTMVWGALSMLESIKTDD